MCRGEIGGISATVTTMMIENNWIGSRLFRHLLLFRIVYLSRFYIIQTERMFRLFARWKLYFIRMQIDNGANAASSALLKKKRKKK